MGLFPVEWPGVPEECRLDEELNRTGLTHRRLKVSHRNKISRRRKYHPTSW